MRPRRTRTSARSSPTELARFGDAFISDGFGVVHRKQASVYELAELLPSAAGLLVETELSVLERLTKNPAKPYTVVLGGSKVSDKLGVIDALLPKVDRLLIGGGMLFTFLKAQGYPIGKSLLDEDGLVRGRRYIDRGGRSRRRTGAARPTSSSPTGSRPTPSTRSRLRTGSKTPSSAPTASGSTSARRRPRVSLISSRASATVFWNGPMGVFEFAPFAAGTKTVAEALTR